MLKVTIYNKFHWITLKILALSYHTSDKAVSLKLRLTESTFLSRNTMYRVQHTHLFEEFTLFMKLTKSSIFKSVEKRTKRHRQIQLYLWQVKGYRKEEPLHKQEHQTPARLRDCQSFRVRNHRIKLLLM